MLCVAVLVRTRLIFFFFNDTATTEIYTLSLHDALPICHRFCSRRRRAGHPFGLTSEMDLANWSRFVRPGCCSSARMLRFVVLCPPLTPGRAERVVLV